jgi:PqqD family protein of HPr-rel-A system
VRWWCPGFHAFSSRCWEEEYFVFNPATGHTHVLNASAWEVLQCCALAARTEADLLERLGQGLDHASRSILAESLPGYLDQLRQLSLLQAMTSRADR